MTTTDTQAADLEAEIRRLRIRISGMTGSQLDHADSSGPSSRDLIRRFLAQCAEVRAGRGRVPEVPNLGDRALADQVVVITSECLPANGADSGQTSEALRLARELRAGLSASA